LKPAVLAAVPAASVAALSRYLRVAQSCPARHRPKLFITHGLSGSGKTWLGQLLREHLPIIQIRSDVERKRLFSGPTQAELSAELSAKHYSDEATERTYGRLVDLARQLIRAGFSVLVDATCLKQRQRAEFFALARELQVPYRILVMQAPMHLLRERISTRRFVGEDASDADIDVLSLQLAQREPLTDAEHSYALFLNGAAPMQIKALLARIAGPGSAPGSLSRSPPR
jgi:predicted kinase